MDKISIIVPVYNTEPYLRKCLDSIVNQTYSNLEILLIDDGSTDNSVDICDEYASRDNRIKVIRKETKGGSGTPCFSQNIGLKMFTGDYVGFCDADDWIEPDMFEVLHKTVKDNNASLGVVSYYFDTEENSLARVNKVEIPKGVLSAKDMLTYMFDNDNYAGFVGINWSKIYSSNIIKNNPTAVFNTELRAWHDLLFDTNIFLTEGCVGAYNPKPLYHWVQHESSISHKFKIKSFTDSIKAINIVLELLDNSSYTDVKHYVIKQYGMYAFGIYNEGLVSENNELMNQGLNELKRFSKNKDLLDFSKKLSGLFLPKTSYALLHNKNVLLFGYGYYGKRAKTHFQENGIKIHSFVDNDKLKQGAFYNNIPVISAEQSLEVLDKIYIITTIAFFFKPIYEQLRLMGISDEEIFII